MTKTATLNHSHYSLMITPSYSTKDVLSYSFLLLLLSTINKDKREIGAKNKKEEAKRG